MKLSIVTGYNDFYGDFNDNIPNIMDKMLHIHRNLKTIFDKALEQARDEVEKESAKDILYVQEVMCDMDNAYDEFYLLKENGEFLSNAWCKVEVVTKEVAENNDKDFLDAEELEEYELGGNLSYYDKLDDKYYFKFMWRPCKRIKDVLK